MNKRLIRDLMIPLDSYATVNQEATLHEAVLALDEACKKMHHDEYHHRAVLVKDKDGRVVGKLSMLDVLRALEPRYREISDFGHSVRYGFSANFIRSMVQHYELWQKPLDDLCRRASKVLVKHVMYTPSEGEYVGLDASLDEAVHQLIIGHHQSLLVTGSQKDVVGILRLTDVYSEVSSRIKSCPP